MGDIQSIKQTTNSETSDKNIHTETGKWIYPNVAMIVALRGKNRGSLLYRAVEISKYLQIQASGMRRKACASGF